MTTKEITQVLREEFKKAGYNNRKVSMKATKYGVAVVIKVEKPNYKEDVKIANIVKGYTRYCGVTIRHDK
jgi:hypothetical protein|nr:MAG TPA: hypothetical protein [Caudoviricetes sp.]